MKKIFCYFAAFAALVSCVKENPVTEPENKKEFSFLAYAPGAQIPESKSILGEDGVSVLWENGDEVKVFVRGKNSSYSNVSSIFTTTLSEASDQAYFKGDLSNAYNNDHQQYAYAVYPSSVNNFTYDHNTYAASVSYDLADEQIAGKDGSFGAYNLASSSLFFDYTLDNENSNALFLNACAVVKVKAPADLNYIKITSNNSTPLAGTADLNFTSVNSDMNLNSQSSQTDNYTYRLVPTAFTEGSASVTLTNGDQPLKKDVVYNIVVWPGEHSQGLTIEMEDTEGKKFKKSSSNAISFVASQFRTFTFSNVEFEEPLKPAVGLYVNNDGSFSNEYISGTSVAKIFWMGDPTASDTQLKSDYPHCTRGLAYEVDGEGNIKESVTTSWNTTSTQKQVPPTTVVNDSDSYTNAENIHGYSNTVAIKSTYNYGFIADIDNSSPVLKEMTSSWYIPSLGELKQIKNITNFTNTNIWTSTVNGEYGWKSGEYTFINMWSIYYITTTGKTANGNGQYSRQGCVRILAF